MSFSYCALLGETIEGGFPAAALLVVAQVAVVAAVADPTFSRFKQFGSRQVFDPGVLQQLQPCLKPLQHGQLRLEMKMARKNKYERMIC